MCSPWGSHALNCLSSHWLIRLKHTWKRHGTLQIPSLHPKDTIRGQTHHPFQKRPPQQKRSKTESRKKPEEILQIQKNEWWTLYISQCSEAHSYLTTYFGLHHLYHKQLLQVQVPLCNCLTQWHGCNQRLAQSQQIPFFCHLCTPVSRKCPNIYLFPNHPDWSDPEEKREYWGSRPVQEEEERREKELKEEELTNNSKSPQTNPDSTEIFNIPNTFKDRCEN